LSTVVVVSQSTPARRVCCVRKEVVHRRVWIHENLMSGKYVLVEESYDWIVLEYSYRACTGGKRMCGENKKQIEAGETARTYRETLKCKGCDFCTVQPEIIDAQDNQQRRSEDEALNILAMNLGQPYCQTTKPIQADVRCPGGLVVKDSTGNKTGIAAISRKGIIRIEAIKIFQLAVGTIAQTAQY
jgi:hypothetical protein